MIEIIPTIIAKDFNEVEEKIKKAELYVDWIQLDIMDGKFVDNTTWNNPADLEEFKNGTSLEAHLMIKNPEEHIDKWIGAGIERIIFHYESTKKHKEILKRCIEKNIDAWIAINPETSIKVLKPLLPLSGILIMTVHPGRGGQKFITKTLEKIKILRQENKDVNIEVDGGINLKTASKAIKAGANYLAVGTAIWKSKDIAETIKSFKNLCR